MPPIPQQCCKRVQHSIKSCMWRTKICFDKCHHCVCRHLCHQIRPHSQLRLKRYCQLSSCNKNQQHCHLGSSCFLHCAGFENPLMVCCGYGGPPYNFNQSVTCGQPGFNTCNEGLKYLSWDGVHYTEAANAVFASKILSSQYSSPKLHFNFFCNK